MFTNPDAYEQFMGYISRRIAPKLAEFARLPGVGHVLDVGSGTGALSEAVAAVDPRLSVTGIDPSPAYVAYAISRNRFGDRVRYRTGDAQALDFQAGTFDAAASLLVWNLIPDPVKALREVVRVTKPGGSITAAVWDYGGSMGILRNFWNVAASLDPEAEKRHEKHMPLCREGELEALWKRCGLKAVQVQTVGVTMHYQSFEDYWRPFTLGQGPAGVYVASLSEEKRDSLREAIRKAYFRSPGEVSMMARAWAVRGTA